MTASEQDLEPGTEDEATILGIGPGDLLGDQFEVGRLLGRGGMGAVHEARDRLLDRKVAIKVLPSFLGSSRRAREGLRREAARAIELAHPALARIHHFGLHRDEPYLVMEFVAGRTLAQRLDDEGPLGLEAALAVLRPLAEGIDYAHARKVVHRDLKPANILLRTPGDSPVLIDFGIAGEVRDQATRSGHTGSSSTTGTLSYMSPEQIRGEPPQPAMDVYALAAVAYELLSGDPPFFRGDPLNVQYQIVHEAPKPVPGLPEAVNQALLQGLAKDPALRPASAGALVAALGGTAATPRPPAPEAPLAAPTRKLPPVPGEPPVAAHEGKVAADTLPVAARPPRPEAPAGGGRGAALAALAGFTDGFVCTFLGGGLWNVWLLNSARAAPEFAAFLAQPATLFLAHFLPPFVAGAVVFALASGLLARWLEERAPGIGAPFLFGVTAGGFLAGVCLCEAFLANPALRHPIEGVGVVLAALCCMFVVAGIGLLMLPDAAGADLDARALGRRTWWGWRIGLAASLPVAVAITGAVIARALADRPPYLLLLDQLAAPAGGFSFLPFAFHLLTWAAVLGPLLALVTHGAAPYLERRFPGTGGSLTWGLALSVLMVLVLSTQRGWFHGGLVEIEAGPFSTRLFRDAVWLGVVAAAVQILWTGRRLALARPEAPAARLAAAMAIRVPLEAALVTLLFELLGGALRIQALWARWLAPIPTLRAATLVPLALLQGALVTLALDRLLGRDPDRDPRHHLLAASALATPLLVHLGSTAPASLIEAAGPLAGYAGATLVVALAAPLWTPALLRRRDAALAPTPG